MKACFGFVGGLLLVSLVLTFWPRPVAERLATLHADGRRVAEVYERMAHDSNAIDVAFIGTSHIMNGIDDRGVEETLAGAGIHAKVTNLGTTWMGRDMHLFLTKELVASKRPQVVVLEINEHEPPYGHPLLPYVATASDIFCCRFLTDMNFPKMYLLFLKEQLYGGLSIFSTSSATPASSSKSWKYGWSPLDRDWDGQMPQKPSLGERIERLIGREARGTAYKISSDFGRQAVRQIVDLLKSNNIRIVFLYLPEYAYAAQPEPENLRFYSNLGPILLPPADLVADRRNWADFGHLNRGGALRLVPYLSGAIADVLTNSAGEGP
jgi:hypothetical protein